MRTHSAHANATTNRAVIVLPSERAQYSAIIDGILASSDLTTISAKAIRKELAAALDVDISDKKVYICLLDPASLEAPLLYLV